MSELEPSEFEGRGIRRWGGFNILSAAMKTRYMKRAERDPDIDYDEDDPDEKFLHGGIPEHTSDGEGGGR